MPEAERAVVPEAAEVLLASEVADTTLRYDRGKQRRLYARAAIAAYWVMDANGRRIFRYSGPANGDYGLVVQSVSGDTIDALVLPAIRLSVAALFA